MPSERHESPVTQATTVGYGHRQSCLWSNETRCSLRKRSSVSLLGRARQEPGGRLQHRTRPPNRHPEHGPPLRPRNAPATKVGITARLRARHKVYCMGNNKFMDNCPSACTMNAIWLHLVWRPSIARLAQSVERGTFNPEVEGSSPSSGARGVCRHSRRLFPLSSNNIREVVQLRAMSRPTNVAMNQ